MFSMKQIIFLILAFIFFLSGCSSTAAIQPTLPVTSIPPTDTATPLLPTAAPSPSATPSAQLGTVALDFMALLCDAKWMNGGQHLTACPAANEDHSGGYAVPIDPSTENLPVGTPVLLTIPATNGYAALFLKYPGFTVHAGDRFRTTLRCQTDAPCDIQYALEYFDMNGEYSGPFLSWNYLGGDPEINVDEDLSSLAGKTVQFVLTLRPQNDDPSVDRSLWISPYIYRSNP
jgi:hypothetical protein